MPIIDTNNWIRKFWVAKEVMETSSRKIAGLTIRSEKKVATEGWGKKRKQTDCGQN